MPPPLNCTERPLGQGRKRGRQEEEEEGRGRERCLIAAEDDRDCSEKKREQQISDRDLRLNVEELKTLVAK